MKHVGIEIKFYNLDTFNKQIDVNFIDLDSELVDLNYKVASLIFCHVWRSIELTKIFAFRITTAAPAHTFALFWSQCLSDSVRGVSWDLTLTNLFLVIVRFVNAVTVRANDIAQNRSRVIFSRACADIFATK